MLVKVKLKPEAEADYKAVASAVRRIGDLGKRLLTSGLTERAITVLLFDATGIPKKDIKAILQALPNLPKWYLVEDSKEVT